MSLAETDVVDAIGTEIDGGTIVLSIIDSWDWTDAESHLVALQAKLNAYFSFVESGQLHEAYPDAVGADLRIEVVSRSQIPDAGLRLLESASAVGLAYGVAVTHRRA